MTPKASPDYAGLTVVAAALARRESGQPLPSLDFAKPVGHDGEHLPVRNEQCWNLLCESVATHDYWCEEHATERRERIKRAMSEITASATRSIKGFSKAMADLGEAAEASADAIRRCVGTTANGSRCKRQARAHSSRGGYICSAHAWQDGVEG